MTVTARRMVDLREVETLLAGLMDRRGYLGCEPFIRSGEAETECRPLPPDKGLRLADFLAALGGLPDPCPELQAAGAIADVVTERGHHFLRAELADAWLAKWPEPGEVDSGEVTGPVLALVPPPAPDGRRCLLGECGEPLPDTLGPNAKYCSAAHRARALRRRRAEEKAMAARPRRSRRTRRQVPPAQSP